MDGDAIMLQAAKGCDSGSKVNFKLKRGDQELKSITVVMGISEITGDSEAAINGCKFVKDADCGHNGQDCAWSAALQGGDAEETLIKVDAGLWKDLTRACAASTICRRSSS